MRAYRKLLIGLGFLCAACVSSVSESGTSQAIEEAAWAPPEVTRADPITQSPWQDVIVSVRDLDTSARFFLEVAGYEIWRRGDVDRRLLEYWNLPADASAQELVLARPGYNQGLVRLVQFKDAGPAAPMRPGARAWDTGCYFSLMVRAKDLQARYDEALALGWWTETPIADLEFGPSTLKIVIFRGPDGLQVQSYERIKPDLPEAIGPFERMTQPFNVMQMVADRDKTRELLVGVLGFETFWFGPPYVDKEPSHMPIGIPYNLTTSVPYGAGIYYPQKGEFGRLETIEIMGLEGRDYSDRCAAPNYGILTVRFPVEDVDAALAAVTARGWPIAREITQVDVAGVGDVRLFGINTPDGAMIDFYTAGAN